jgi:hypothetical protein
MSVSSVIKNLQELAEKINKLSSEELQEFIRNRPETSESRESETKEELSIGSPEFLRQT